MAIHSCQTCGPTEVEVDDRMGHTVCVLCGSVIELNTIVSEVTFTDTGKGSSLADGFSVSSSSARAKSSGKFGLIRTGGQEPREQTIQNGHRKISEIASQPQIRMAERHIQSAQRFFNLAVINNFTKGRKSHAVVAACLYIVCRMEKTAHMLIDFADALSVRILLLIFQINVFQLGATFLKLVQLLHLKLPLVDPALYISRFADRLDFGDKVQRVIKDANRLAQRMNRDWLQTGRRPAGICAASLFVAARIHGFKRTHKEIILVVKICENTLRKRLYEFSSTPSGNLTVNEFQTLWLEEEKDPPAYVRAREKKFEASAKSADAPLKHARSDDEHESHDDELPTPPHTEDNIDDEESQSTLREMMEILEREDTERLEKSLSSYGLMEEGDENLSDLDDDLEVQNMLAVSTDEVEFKTMMWTDENKDWIAAQEAKKLQESDKQNQPRSKAQKKRQKRETRSLPAASSAAEAARNLIKSKPALSKKINYSILDNLFDGSVPSSPPSASDYSVTGFGQYVHDDDLAE